jgi:hypothetical protein
MSHAERDALRRRHLAGNITSDDLDGGLMMLDDLDGSTVWADGQRVHYPPTGGWQAPEWDEWHELVGQSVDGFTVTGVSGAMVRVQGHGEVRQWAVQDFKTRRRDAAWRDHA